MRINSKICKRILKCSLLLLSAFVSLPAFAALTIFACEPEYSTLAEELAPDANIYSATTAMQDPHLVQAKPSLIAKMRRADLAVCAGADLEIGWLPMLQMKSANSAIRSTDHGLFFAADQVNTLDKLPKVDRVMGDVHAKGNPHVHFDPQYVLIIAKALANKMTQLDPAHASQYQANLKDFVRRWQSAIPRWKKQASGLKGMKVIAYHSNFRYLFNWLGVEQVADLEPKPGLPPSSAHLAKLLAQIKQGGISAIVIASYQDQRGADWLAQRSGLPIVVLPLSVGGNKQSQDLFSLYTNVITRLNKVKS